ncbi:hypothetical protein V8E52_003908 [Russula decolorans]
MKVCLLRWGGLLRIAMYLWACGTWVGHNLFILRSTFGEFLRSRIAGPTPLDILGGEKGKFESACAPGDRPRHCHSAMPADIAIRRFPRVFFIINERAGYDRFIRSTLCDLFPNDSQVGWMPD